MIRMTVGRVTRAALALVAFLAALSCGGGGPTPPSCAVSSVVIQPSQLSLSVTASGTLDASVSTTNCSTPPSVTWASKNPGAVSITANGTQAQVTAVSFVAGGVLITATAGGRADTATVTVLSSPTIALNPGTAGFTAVQGGANPVSQQVTITNGGGGILNGLAVGSIAYGAGATGWLQAPTLNSTSASPSATLTLQPITGSLVPGTYTATVPITSAVASNSPQNVAVTFTVAAPGPSITLSASSLGFSAIQVGVGPSNQTITITYHGGGTFSDLGIGPITYGPGATGWLYAPILTPATVSSADMIVVVSDVALPPGTYTATVPILSAVASNSPQNLSVTLNIAPGGVCPTAGAPTLSVGQTIADSLAATDCQLASGAYADVYLLTLAGQTDLMIDLTTTVFSSRLTLYNGGTGAVIATAFPNLGQQSTRLTRRLNAGTYLIQGIGSGTGAYQIAASTAPVPIPNDGTWVGTGSDGKTVSFTVQLDTVVTFAIEIGPLGSAGSSCSIVRLNTWTFNDGMITGGTFSFNFMPGVGVSAAISGSIAGLTSATGNYTDIFFTNLKPCGPTGPSFTGSVPGRQWTAARK